jgi:4-hydroxy-tetrahydrodipicolinate reductase
MPALALFGITGRMGQSVLRALKEAPAFTLTGAIASAQSPRLGADAAGSDIAPTGVLITSDPVAGLRGASVAIDFSSGLCAAEHARACAAARVPILIGTTGLDADGRGVLQQAARDIAVLIAPNTSIGLGVVAQLVAQAARALGPAYDVEIVEVHHRMKRDAPSGTALLLGETVAAARGESLGEVAAYDRSARNAPRTPGSIGFCSARAGDVVGEHTVIFAGDGERVEIIHRATDRSIFARGALRAAEWLAGQPAGLYGMQHVLGLE